MPFFGLSYQKNPRGEVRLLFNSMAFLFVFLPVTAALCFVAARYVHRTAALSILLIASLLFYGWDKPSFVLVIVGSILGNFLFSLVIHATTKPVVRKLILVAAIGANLALL